MYCDFYSFHDKVDFCVNETGSTMPKFKFEFTITYKGLTYTSFCKSYERVSSDSSSNSSSCYMMRKRSPNRSMTYFLSICGSSWRFTLNQQYNELFEKWLSQFPICIDLD